MATETPKVITVTIDLDAVIPTDATQIGEDEWQHAPTTMRDLIVAEAARLVSEPIKEQAREDAAKLIKASAERLVDEALPEIIEAALNESQTITDDWGHPKGTKTLRDIVRDRVAQQTKESNGNAFSQETVFTRVVREQIDHALASDFKTEIDAAKAAVRAKLSAKAADLLAAETLREAGIR